MMKKCLFIGIDYSARVMEGNWVQGFFKTVVHREAGSVFEENIQLRFSVFVVVVVVVF